MTTRRSLGLVATTVIDFEEATLAIETVGQTTALPFAVASVGEGATEPFFTFNETLETTIGIDDADGLSLEFPDSQERWVHFRMETVALDAGIGAVEAEDFFDIGIAVNGIVVARSDEGRQDAADTSPSMTLDVAIAVEDGDVVNFVLIGDGDEDEEFTMTVEAGEADVLIAGASG